MTVVVSTCFLFSFISILVYRDVTYCCQFFYFVACTSAEIYDPTLTL
jgi:hypothetical protein